MQLPTEPLSPEYRFVLQAKLGQADESGDAALMTAGVLATAMVVALKLLGEPVGLMILLGIPMLVSGVVTYGWCHRRMRTLQADIDEATVIVGSGRSRLTRYDGSAEGSFSLKLPDRTVAAYSKGAGLRNLLVRPDSGTFAGSFAYAPHSGQLLRLKARTGRAIFDAAATELNETFDFSELGAAI